MAEMHLAAGDRAEAQDLGPAAAAGRFYLIADHRSQITNHNVPTTLRPHRQVRAVQEAQRPGDRLPRPVQARRGKDDHLHRAVFVVTSWAQTIQDFSPDPFSRKFTEAQHYLARSLQLVPEQPLVRYNLAVAHIQQGDADSSLLQPALAVNEDPRYGRAWYLKAQIENQLGMSSAAYHQRRKR